MRIIFSWHFVVLIIAITFLGCTGRPRIIEQKCSVCHQTSIVYSKKRPMAEWERLIYGMKVRGLKITPDEERDVMDALSKYYSK
jgi:hypothetical protein